MSNSSVFQEQDTIKCTIGGKCSWYSTDNNSKNIPSSKYIDDDIDDNEINV